jgi:choline kinase
MKAIILNAGRSRRMLPLTADRPKCLLSVSGRTILEWQLRALAAAGTEEVAVVVGFAADRVAAQLAVSCPSGMQARTIFNPDYDRADNLVSCIVARPEMTEDFLLLNGDTLFEPEIIGRLLANGTAPVAMAVASKADYDADDMKIRRTNGRVSRIGKDLRQDETDGEAIGVSLFQGDGPRLFAEALDRVARDADANRRWYLSAVNLLAASGLVHAVRVNGLHWTEIDYVVDLRRAEGLMFPWSEERSEVMSPIASAVVE